MVSTFNDLQSFLHGLLSVTFEPSPIVMNLDFAEFKTFSFSDLDS